MAQKSTKADQSKSATGGQKQGSSSDPGTAEEARNLAREGVEELKHGDKEEGRFVLDEARKLDPKAAEEVIRESGAAMRKG